MVRKIIRSTTLVFALYYLQLKPTVVLPVDAQEPMRGASGEVVTMRTSLSGTRGWSRWGRCTPTSTTDTGKTRSASTKATLSGCGGHSTAYWLIPPMTTIVRFLPTISPSISRTRLTPPTRLLTRRRCTTFHAGWRLRRCHRRRGRETDQLCAELGMPARSSAHVACYRHELAAFALRRFVKNKSLACLCGLFPCWVQGSHRTAAAEQRRTWPHRPGELQASSVSNLPFLCKLSERVVQAHLQAHLDGSSLLPGWHWQSVYRRLHSTETAVTKVFNDLLDAIDLGQMSALCLLDLSSAFDTVDHDLLLQRHERQFGLCGTVLQWIRSYVSGRTFRVVYWRCALVRCYVLSSARLSPWSAVLHPVHGGPYGPGCQVRHVSSRLRGRHTAVPALPKRRNGVICRSTRALRPWHRPQRRQDRTAVRQLRSLVGGVA